MFRNLYFGTERVQEFGDERDCFIYLNVLGQLLRSTLSLYLIVFQFKTNKNIGYSNKHVSLSYTDIRNINRQTKLTKYLIRFVNDFSVVPRYVFGNCERT